MPDREEEETEVRPFSIQTDGKLSKVQSREPGKACSRRNTSPAERREREGEITNPALKRRESGSSGENR